MKALSSSYKDQPLAISWLSSRRFWESPLSIALLALPLACSSGMTPSLRDARSADLASMNTGDSLLDTSNNTSNDTPQIVATDTDDNYKTGGVTAKGGNGGNIAITGGTIATGGIVDAATPKDAMTQTETPSTIPGMDLPPRAAVLEAMDKANNFFVQRWPDPTVDIVTDKARPSNLWTRAVYFEGQMALYATEPDATKKARLYEYAVRWGESPTHPWTLTYTAASAMTNNADNQCCGQTYIDLYQIDPQPKRIATIKANMDDMVSRKTSNVWTWIDAIQMSMPVFARLGVIDSDTRYFDAMWALYNNARTQQGGGLRNPDDGLWWRDLHFTPGGGPQQRMTAAIHGAIPKASSDAYFVAPNGKNLYWSRGNGWVMAALVRVLDWLPVSDSHWGTYIADFQTMAASLLPLQRSDGFWNESLLDPTHCASIGQTGQDGPETSGTALFAYGLAWGIRQKHLDSAIYGPALAKAWHGLVTIAQQTNGALGYVQSTGDRPCTDSGPLSPTKLANFDDYGVGAFLLAGSEIYRLAN